MALTKITSNLIGSNAISAGNITDASITADDLHATLDLTAKTVTVATASAGDNDTSVASTAFVKTAIDNIIDGAPAGLNTLNEIAASLNDDTGLNTTLVNSIATKAPLATPQFTNRVGIGVAAHGTAALNITSTDQHMRLNNGSELGIISLLSTGELELWGHGDGESINFRTGSGAGTVAMNIVGNNVGITNTSTLNANLHIGSASATGDATNPALQIGGASTYRLGMYTSTEGAVIANANGDDGIQFVVKTAGEAMRIDGGTGNVGIGESSPDRHLHLTGSGANDARIKLENTSASYYAGLVMTASAKEFHVGVGGASVAAGYANNLYIHDATAGALRATIDTSGNVGINDANPDRKLSIIGDTSSNGQYPLSLDAINTDYTLEFRRNGQSEWWIKQAGSSFKIHENGVGDHFTLLAGGNIGIGETNPDSILHIKRTNNSAGDLYTGIGPGNAPGMTIQNGGTTDSNHATIFFKNDSGHRAHIGAKFVNHSTEQTDLTFGVTDASGNARERLHLKANTNNGADFIGYEGPNATSSTAGDNWHLVADSAMEVKQDNNNASSWIAMKTFTLGANCKSLSIKWAAKNASGTYYWAWRITRNGTVMSMVNHGGGNAQKSFAYGLASGQSSSVHAFRSFDVDVGEAFAGDVIQLEMINSDGGGTPAAGTQYLYAKQFLVTSLDKGKIYNGDRGTIRKPMIYGATQSTGSNGNEYNLGHIEIPFWSGSGTHSIIELAEFGQGTVAHAELHYAGLYAYAGRNFGQGMTMSSTRRRSNNSDWEDIDGGTVYFTQGANGDITAPDFYWADGVLKVGISSSVQLTGYIKVTWAEATIQRHWNA